MRRTGSSDRPPRTGGRQPFPDGGSLTFRNRFRRGILIPSFARYHNRQRSVEVRPHRALRRFRGQTAVAGLSNEWSAGGFDSAGSTSTGLIAAARARDEDAWRRLVQRYGPLVYHWCRRDGLRPEDAADIVQEVLRSVALHLERFRKQEPGDTFRGWLWTITRNKVRDFARRGRRQFGAAGGTDAHDRLQNLPDSLSAGDAESTPGGCGARATPVAEALDAIRGEFSDRTWQAFWRTTVDGLSSRQVAEELNVTANAVRLAKARVLRRLRKQLGGEVP
jgi:RNA polymerase sigma-70 factor, ECF subfamily